jgi:hypothetical protein
MVRQLEPQFQKDFSAGMVTNINENIIPRNAVALGLNGDFDNELGSFVSRLGTGIVGAQLVDGMTVLGLHQFLDHVTPANNKLFAAINASGGATSVIYDVIAGTTSVTGLTASKKVRFLAYLGSLLALNGTDTERSYTPAGGWVTTGGAFDLANFPGSNKCNIVLEFLDRVYAAGDTVEPDRLYYSSVQTSGAVSWTSGNGFIDIEPEDGGGAISALGKVPGFLIIFKERSMKRFNLDSGADPESLVDIGTPSQESVISKAGLCAFFSASSRETQGFYITNGARPVPISHLRAKNIQKWVQAIPQSFHANVNGWGTENHFYWSIGDVTVDGTAYTNVVLRWSVKTGEWAVRTYPSEFRVWALYRDASGNNTTVAGDDNGHVIELDKPATYSDYAEGGVRQINWDVCTFEEDFDYNQIKDLKERLVYNTRRARGAEAYVRVNGGPYRGMGSIEGDISEIELKEPLRGNYFQFGLRGQTDGRQAVLKEIEIPNIFITEKYV